MIVTLSNGKKIILNDVAKDPKTEAIKWLRQYKARQKENPGCDPGSRNSSEERNF